MTQSALPPGIDPDDEISVTWHTDEEGSTKVVSKLGGAEVTVITDEASASLVPWLIASTPQILEAAWAEIERQNNQEET